MKNKWLWWSKNDLRIEQRQLLDEGCNIDSIEAEFDKLLAPDVVEDTAFQKAVNSLLDKTGNLPIRPDYGYIEPSELEGIRNQRPPGTK